VAQADTVTNVRCELTISLRKLAIRNKNDDTTRTNLEALLDRMRNDVSYRVRAEATTDVSPDGDGS
jgi:hypothetical protein